MLAKLTEKNLQFLEMWYDPVAQIENLIPENLKAPHTWSVDCKCIAEDSDILMSDFTTKKIQDIEIGDEILTFFDNKKQYRKCKVYNKIYNGEKQVARLTTNNGMELDLTLDHKVLSRSESHSQWLWLQVQNLINHNVITIPHHITDMNIYLYGQLFGFIDSDGTLVKKNGQVKHIKIYQKVEKEAVVWLLNKLKLKYHMHEDRPKFYSFTLRVDNPILLLSTFLSLLEHDKNFQYGYLCGFTLGDGSYDKKNAHWVISQKKAQQTRRIGKLLDIFCLNSKGWNSNSVYSYYIPKFVIPFYNPSSRKIDKFFDSVKNKKAVFTENLISKIKKIKLIGIKKVWDLSTEGNTFIANNILVHNCVTVRNYQFPMVNYSYLFANNPKLTPKQNVTLKKYAGKLINLAARNIGKSYCAIFDAFLHLLHSIGGESCVASFDSEHVRKISTPIKNLAEYHPFFEMLKRKGKSSVRFAHGAMEIDTLRGHTMYGKNENVNDPEPGDAFHSLHASWWLYDEAQAMSKLGTEKRVDAVDSLGYIERLSGINDIRIGSPLGEILADEDNDGFICNLPQFCRDDWDDDSAKEQEKKYNGRESMGWKLNVEGEKVEGAFGFWDIARIKKECVNQKKEVKIFEVGKDTFHMFEQILILERIACEQCFIAADMGEGAAPTEIIVIFYDGTKYKYHYNITLQKLTTFEQEQIFFYLCDILNECYVAVDATSVSGRDLIDALVRRGIPIANVLKVNLNENIEVDFIKNNKGVVELDPKTGEPLVKKEKALEIAMSELEKLFYNGKIDLPFQHKFFYQFTNIICKKTGNKPSWASTIEADHLHAAFQVFGVQRRLNKFKSQIARKPRKSYLGGF